MAGPGYRIYFGRDGTSLVLLLTGGTKASQAKDIRRAQGLLARLSGEDVTWHDAVETGTKDWRRTCATRSSHASSFLQPWMREWRSRPPLER